MRRQKIRRTDIKKAEDEAEEAERNKPSLLFYMPAFVLAIMKDLLDLIGVGSIPAIGTVVTILFSIAIFICLILVKANGSVANSRFVIRRLIIFLCVMCIEAFFFVLNFLPIETLTVLVIFLLDRYMTNQQIERFNSIAKELRTRKVKMSL